jgi:hypothetical protein
VVFLQKYGILGFSWISRIILLKKSLWNRFIAVWTGSTPLAHGAPNRNRFLAIDSWIYGEDFIWMKHFAWSNLVRPNPIERWEATSDATRRRSLLHGGAMPGTAASPVMALTCMGELVPLRDYAQNRAAVTGILMLGDLRLGVASRWCCGVGFLSPSLVDDVRLLRCTSSSKDVHGSFLELPSSFSTDQLLRTAAKKLEFGGYRGFGGFLTCGRKFTL